MSSLLEQLKAQQRRSAKTRKKTAKKTRKKTAKKTRKKTAKTAKRATSRGERLRATLRGYYRRGELGKASRLRARMKKAGLSTKVTK